MKRIRDGGAKAVSFCASVGLLPTANWLWQSESVRGEREEEGGRRQQVLLTPPPLAFF